jgi:hypothetical protein
MGGVVFLRGVVEPPAEIERLEAARARSAVCEMWRA